MMRVSIKFLLAFMVLFGLTACESSEENKRSSTQVAAKVNGAEVTINQVNQALNKVRTDKVNENKDELKNNVLSKIIDQELLVQEAIKLQLDRKPNILSQMELAKREVLIKAYLNRMLPSPDDVSEADIREYYNNNKDLFAERMRYKYLQIVVQAEADIKANLVEFLKGTEDIKDIKSYIESKGYVFREKLESNASENIPKQLREAFTKLKENDIGFVEMGDGVLIFSMIEKKPDSITLEKSRPIIVQLITKEKRQESGKSLLETLRKKSQVEYLNGFAAGSMAN